MMKKLLLFVFACMMSIGASAQVRWTGVDYNTLSTGDHVFLYNVGTGRFLIHGGDWGTQARLFYEDTGKMLTFKINNGRYVFGTDQSTGGAEILGCNVPLVTSQQPWTNDEETFTILMDANENYSGSGSVSGTRSWNFIPVDEGNGTYTYYLQEVVGDSTVYLGATYGENWGNHEGDPNGKLTLLSSSYDKAVWTTADPRDNDTEYEGGLKPVEGEGTYNRTMADEVPIFNEDTKIPLRDLYKWRIVTLEQIEAAADPANDVTDGLTTNLTYLIYDRGLERNDWTFFNWWTANQFNGDPSLYPSNPQTENGTNVNRYRYGYTWGYLTGSASGKALQSTGNTTETPWNKPIRLKSQWDSKTDAKFGFLEFEGVGTVSTSVEAPQRGSYMVSSYGFYQGENPGYLFVSTKDPASSDFTPDDIVNKVPFVQSSTVYTKNTSDGVKAAGNDFVYNKDPYYVQVEISEVEANATLYIGVAKFAATEVVANESTTGGTTTTTYSAPMSIRQGTNGSYLYPSGNSMTSNTNTKIWYLDEDNYLYYMNGDTKTYLTYTGSRQRDGNSRYYYSIATTTTRSTSCVINTGLSLTSANVGGGTYLQATVNSTTCYLRYYNSEFRLYEGSNRNEVYVYPTATTTTSGGSITRYSYDSDWVCADQFQLYYLGSEDPVYLDEDETSLDYLGNKTYQGRTVRLKRSFVKNTWNTFVFPFNMTAVQIRNAFGDATRVAALDGLGTLSGHPQCIDFKSVELPSEGNAIEAGHFYLIKPANDPATTTTSTGAQVKYYNMGKYSFTANELPDIESVEVAGNESSVTGLKSYATYVKSAPYTNSLESYDNDIYVPAGAYVVGSKNTGTAEEPNYTETYMSKLTKNMRIKGFRGWLEDNESSQGAKITNLSLNGHDLGASGEATSIEDIITSEPMNGFEGIYDLTGRRIADDAQTLNKGLYIINGKKVLIK